MVALSLIINHLLIVAETDAGLHEPPGCATSAARLLVAAEDELEKNDDAVPTFI